VLPFFFGLALVWGASWLIPSTYRSGTLILVEQPSVPEKYVVSNIDSDIQQQLESITQQILSRTRLLRIIDSLGLYAQDRKHRSPDDLVDKMRKDIEIELSHGDDRKLSAFNIYYASRDPKTAQAATSDARNGMPEPFYFCDPYDTGPKFTWDGTGAKVRSRPKISAAAWKYNASN